MYILIYLSFVYIYVSLLLRKFSMSNMNQQKSTKTRIAKYIEDKYKGVQNFMFETGSSLSY